MSKEIFIQKLRNKLEIIVKLVHTEEYDFVQRLIVADSMSEADYAAFSKFNYGDFTCIEWFWNSGATIDPLVWVAYKSDNATVKDAFQNWLFYSTATITPKEAKHLIGWVDEQDAYF